MHEMQERIGLLFDVLKRYDHYVGTTNFKIGLMMSFLLTVVLGLTLRVIMFGSNDCIGKFVFFLLVFFVIITVAISFAAFFQLFGAVFPHTKESPDYKSLIFFGDVARSPNGAEGYYEKIKDVPREDLLKDLAFQVFAVAELTGEKFRKLQTAVNLIKFGVLPPLFISIVLILTIH